MNVPDIQGSQVSQPSGQMYSYNDCSLERLSYDEQELKKIFSLLYLGGILGENLWYLLTAFPLVSKYHQPDTIPVVQYPSSKPAEGGLSFLRIREQFLYNLYDIHSSTTCVGLMDEISNFFLFYPAIIKHIYIYIGDICGVNVNIIANGHINLDEIVCISQSINIFGKGMNPNFSLQLWVTNREDWAL